MEDDSTILIPEDKYLMIGNKKFKIWISAERSLKATAMFNRISKKGTEEHDRIETDLDFYNEIMNVAFLLIRQDFKITRLFDWIRRELITKKYILKHMDIKELALFVDEALEPIIGTKKKEKARQEKASEAMMIIMETITPEQLALLLQNSLQAVDTQKAM